MKAQFDTKALSAECCVLGGGTSGAIAAIAAARSGLKVILVEKNHFLGGTMASGLGLLGYNDRSGRPIIGGIALELVEELKQTDDTLGHNYCPILNSLTPINAQMMKLLLVKKCREAGVQMLFGCEAMDADSSGGHLRSVTVHGKGHRYKIAAPVFIDATGDGDVAYMAGIPCHQDGEPQPASLIFSLSNVEREALLQYIEAHPEQAKTPEGYEMDTSADFYRRAVGYNFLGLDGIIEQARVDGNYKGIPRDRFSTITHPTPDTMVINNTRVLGIDGSDLMGLTQGTVEAYKQLKELLGFIPKYIPGYANSHLSAIAPMLGVRESRRFAGIRTVTGEQARAGVIPADTVALCGYNIDIHHPADEGGDLLIIERPYGIPYGVMISKSVENLLFTGRAVSVDSVAFGSSRIMSTCMALGEAAGVAAALCCELSVAPTELPAEPLRARLLQQNAILEVGS